MQNSKLQFKIQKYLSRNFKFLAVVFSFSLCAFSFIPTAFAAKLYLEPSSGEYQPGDTFMVDIGIDTEGECINAIEANLSFSQDILKAVDFSQGNSILTLWVKSPTLDQDAGLISFSGGIPGGYCGRIPGDPGESNLLGKVIFRIPGMMVREPGADGEPFSVKIGFLENSQVLLNDGFGTPAKLTTRGAIFQIVAKRSEPLKEDWAEEIKKDTIPPEPFEIEISQDPLLFDGKYFIVFFTADKQTGMDYYEVKEGKGDWQRAESPYLLEDQKLDSIIKVRAVDKAGNERIAEYIPPTVEKPFPWWIIILILVGIGVIWQIVRKIKR